MKNFIFILFSILIFTSCTKEDNSPFDINGMFTYNIPNCDNGGNPEIHCTLFINFVNDSNVSPISITGGDIVYETSYVINKSIIKFNKSSKFNFNVSFEIINNKTLKRIEDNTIWVKEE